MVSKNTEEHFNTFKKDATAKHGGNSSYHKCTYFNYSTKVCLVCNKCGKDYWQSPSKHLDSPYGFCQNCSKKLQTIVANDTKKKKLLKTISDRSKTLYSLEHKLHCIFHTAFEVEYLDVTYHSYCPFCKEEDKLYKEYVREISNHYKKVFRSQKRKELSEDKKATQLAEEREFLGTSCILKHKNKYKVNKNSFKKWSTKVSVVCELHGNYATKPRRLLNSDTGGCKKCAIKASATAQSKTHEQFLIDFNDKGLYKKFSLGTSVYVKARVPISVTCLECSFLFPVTPDNLLRGKGCPNCNDVSVYNKKAYIDNCVKNHNGFSKVYVLKCVKDSEEFYKIGITVHKIYQRFNKANMPYKFEILREYKLQAKVAWELEKELHKYFKQSHYTPKISFGGGKKECFSEIALNYIDERLTPYTEITVNELNTTNI